MGSEPPRRSKPSGQKVQRESRIDAKSPAKSIGLVLAFLDSKRSLCELAHWPRSYFMNPEFAVDLLKDTMLQAATLASPVLVTAMTIGLMVSLFQAVTSIHEQTLSFVPKVLGIMALLVAILPWMTKSMLQFTQGMIERMPQMVH